MNFRDGKARVVPSLTSMSVELWGRLCGLRSDTMAGEGTGTPWARAVAPGDLHSQMAGGACRAVSHPYGSSVSGAGGRNGHDDLFLRGAVRCVCVEARSHVWPGDDRRTQRSVGPRPCSTRLRRRRASARARVGPMLPIGMAHLAATSS